MKSVPTPILLSQFQNDINCAKEELMRRCLHFVKSKLHSVNIKCKDQKEELVMQVMMKIITKINTFVPNEAAYEHGFWAWVSTISYNNYMEFIRNKKKAYLFYSVDDTYENGNAKFEIEDNNNWLQYVTKKDKFVILVRAAKQLPDKYYTIIKLKYWFNMNTEEVAKYLNEEEVNVRVMHHRAIKKLQMILGPKVNELRKVA
jgi:RNA polymerase sigma factor (sigma-70 family)